MTVSRQAFLPTGEEWVECFVCGRILEPVEADGPDISNEQDYHAVIKPVCPNGNHREHVLTTDGGTASTPLAADQEPKSHSDKLQTLQVEALFDEGV